MWLFSEIIHHTRVSYPEEIFKLCYKFALVRSKCLRFEYMLLIFLTLV